jgi:hypothetical protein
LALSERYLIEGAWYALEQAGLLLREAVLLSKNQRDATAKGLALLARECPFKKALEALAPDNASDKAVFLELLNRISCRKPSTLTRI